LEGNNVQAEDDILMHLLAVVLQTTDSLNFRLLKFFADNRERFNPFKAMSINKGRDQNQRNLETIFRLFEAQPFLKQVWDASSIYSLQGGGIVVSVIKSMLHTSDETLSLKEHIELDKLRVNKSEQNYNRSKHDKMFGELES